MLTTNSDMRVKTLYSPSSFETKRLSRILCKEFYIDIDFIY